MNDRFKFRVWNKSTHSFTTGGSIKFGGLCFVDTEDFGIKPAQDQENYIIEQCTGLKDKNGNLIYEGDIMEHRIYLGNPELYIVKWSESVNGWVYQDVRNSLKTSYILTEFTDSIIGNIHENKELLDEC